VSSVNIVGFLRGNEDIKNDIFFILTGEFDLHTITLNVNGYYYHIGYWTLTESSPRCSLQGVRRQSDLDTCIREFYGGVYTVDLP